MSLWDAEQRDWLQAMGHSLLTLAADEPAEVPAVREEVAEVGHVGGGDVRARGMAPAREPVDVKPPVRARPTAPPSAEPTSAPSPPRTRTDPAAKLAALEAARRAGAARNASGPLGEALLRATGQPPVAAARMLRELAIDPAALRDDPAAKRMLWARMRPLRKATAG